MQRLLALLLVLALTAAAGVASLLHTHAYDGHDHPRHHHGIAAHDHHQTAPPVADGAIHLESCDPAKHTIAVAFVSAAPPGIDVPAAETVVAAPLTPPTTPDRGVRQRDVRAHGPPFRADAPPRAPPATPLT